MQFANRIKQIVASPTLAVSTKAAILKKQGLNIISLATGEPDFPTPEHICAAAIQAIKAGQTKYTPVAGTFELIAAIQHKFLTENNLQYAANEIIASTGAKQAIYNLMQVLLNPGDEVIIPAPYWVSYPDMVKLAEATPVIVTATIDDNFKIKAKDLAAAINKNTKLVILNSPNNPTGAVYSKEELLELALVLQQHPHVYILSDDIYEHILFNDESYYNILNVAPDLRDRTIVINGVSKSYAMTGWRLGFAAAPKEIIAKMNIIQGQSTSNPCSITQAATVAALTGNKDFLTTMKVAFKRRNEITQQKLAEIPGIRSIQAAGAFYSFFDASQLIKKLPNINNDIELAEFFLQAAHVAMVPGNAFGAPDYMRISFALSDTDLITALDKMKQAVMEHC